MAILVWAIRVLLTVVFAIAGIAKLADLAGARKSILDFGVPAFLAGPLAFLVPVAELVCAGALLWPGSAVWGAAGLLGMLFLFSATIGLSLARGNRPNCRCFGQLNSSPIGAKTLARNVVLAVMAGFVLWQAPNADSATVWSSLSRFQTGLPAAAAAFGLLLIFHLWTTFVLLRQNGRLLLRVEALEAKVVGKDEPESPGLPKDSPAPQFSLGGLDGEMVTLDGLLEAGRPVFLIFGEPGCGPCEQLFPEIAQWQKEHEERLSVVLISGGKLEANRNRRDKHGLRNVLVQTKGEIAQAYRSGGTPAAVLIKDGKIASRLAEGADAIRTLIVRSLLPPPVKRGEQTPSLQLPDLQGKVLDLATLGGRHTLLLFWNPDCGYCQSMLTDLQTQERVRPPGARFILVAAGSAEVNRAQGFRSRVLLDPHFAAGTLFGAEGTPAAVLIDEEGRVASDVRIGSCGSFELLGFLPYVQTPDATVAAMLKLADVRSSDTLYDLGCGDGRVVIAAAQKYQARGMGVDINPERIAEARANARKASVEHLVKFEEGQLFDADIRTATVVTIYMLPKINIQLRSKFLSDLKPGTRVVSHAFDMEDWKPDREEMVGGERIYLWTIPASKDLRELHAVDPGGSADVRIES